MERLAKSKAFGYVEFGHARDQPRQGRPRDSAAAVLDHCDVVPTREEVRQRGTCKAMLEHRPVVLPNERHRDQRVPAVPQHATDFRHSRRRIGDVMEAFDAHDQVERLVGKGKELSRDDIGDSVWVAWNIEANDAGRWRQQVVIGPRAAEDIEDVLGLVAHTLQRRREIADEPADVQVVELSRTRPPARPLHLREDFGRERLVSPARTDCFLALRRRDSNAALLPHPANSFSHDPPTRPALGVPPLARCGLVRLVAPCHSPVTEACGYAQGERSVLGLVVGRWHLLLLGCLLAGALLLRIDGITRPSLSTRELHNALLAREYYLGSGPGLPAWKQNVLRELRVSVKPVEPPLLDHVAAWGYRLRGREDIWIPRLVSAVLWVLAGILVYLIGLRTTRREGALVAAALYLFWPYGVLMSRFYMPDPTMVAFLLAGAFMVIRYWERPSPARLLIAAGVAAAATFIKPGIALIFLAILFAVLAVSQRVRARAIWARVLLFVGIAGAPTAGYFIYGSYIRHFLAAEGDAGERVQPHLLVTEWFWRGWWEMISIVLPFPQTQRDLALIPLTVALAGLIVGGRKATRPILAGLVLGYLVYAFAVAAYTASHPYYALPLIPILALAIGTLVGFLIERLGGGGPKAFQVVAALVVLVAVVATYKSRPFGPDRTAIADYRRIGALTGHTTDAVIVDERLRAPAMYWGWIVGHYWYPPTPAEDLPASGDPFPSWIDAAQTTYVIVVGTRELQTERRLQGLTRDLPVVANTDRFVVFDARGGRLARAAASGGG